MRAVAIAREAWRDITTGTARTLQLAIAAAAIALLLSSADVFTIHQLVERARDFRNSGASTSILTASGRVDGERCDALADLRGVRAAGGVRATADQLRPTVLPLSPIPISESTPGFTAVLRADPVAVGVLLGPEAADALGLTGGDDLATRESTAHVAGTYPAAADGRRPGLSYAAVAPTLADRPFDECWVDAWPVADLNAALLTTVLVGDDPGDPPQIAQLNSTRGRTFDGPALFSARPTRFAGVCAAAAGFALGWLSVRRRRLALASALHAGVAPGALRSLATLEAVAWTAAAAGFAAPSLILIGVGLGTPTETTVAGLLVQLPLWFGGIAGAWTAASTIRERHLFRYFTSR